MAQVYLASLGENENVTKQADELYNRLTAENVQVLYDDRAVRPGEKFADADLMGIPYRVVVSDKTVASQCYELKPRASSEASQVSYDELLKTIRIA